MPKLTLTEDEEKAQPEPAAPANESIRSIEQAYQQVVGAAAQVHQERADSQFAESLQLQLFQQGDFPPSPPGFSWFFAENTCLVLICSTTTLVSP